MSNVWHEIKVQLEHKLIFITSLKQVDRYCPNLVKFHDGNFCLMRHLMA